MLLRKFEQLLMHRLRIRPQELVQYEKGISILLDKAINHGNETISFICWKFLHCITIINNYYEIFTLLQNRQYYEAWKKLETNEYLILDLKRNKVECDLYKIINYIDEYTTKFQSLYPYKIFASPEYYVTKMRCSICNKIVDPISGCHHIAGRVYLGRMCIHEVLEMQFISIACVETPQQKYSVMFDEIENPQRYQVLEYFIPKLSNPFMNWTFSVYTEYIKDKNYKISDEEICPCNSKKLYKDCCKKRLPLKPRPHYEFIHL